MRSLHKLWILVALAAAACGGESDDKGSGKTPEELTDEIYDEADRLNSCTAVDDCAPVAYGCSSLYVNAGADITHLQALIAEKNEALGGPTNCAASCACGILSCDGSKCVTSAEDCMNAPPGSTMVCL